MMTHRERLLKVARGELVDKIPWVPRIDLWHNAHALAGTLPEKYQGLSVEEIHRKEGWPLHKVVPEYLKPDKPEDIIHRAIGLYRLKEFPYDFEFSSDVDIEVEYENAGGESMTHVAYHTPVGMVSVRHGITEEMKKSGASITWVKETALKGPEDYKILAHIFGNLKLKPAYERFAAWKEAVGEDGIAVGQGLGIGCSSPMHFIQKTLIGATNFYYHYHDYRMEMQLLSEALANAYNQLISVLMDSPADAVLWSANVDDMITYPSYFEKEILPWCRKASEALRPQGKLMIMHPDGENRGLMDLIPESGMDIADAVTPYPMTKVTIDEYYDRWCRSDKLTIQGGIPEIMLLEESTSWDDLKNYLDHLFQVISPGKRLIASIGDTSPPKTDFDRLLYIGERFEKEGRLPLEAGAGRPFTEEQIQQAKSRVSPKPLSPQREELEIIQKDVLDGDEKKIIADVQQMLEKNFSAQDILNLGMLSAMEIIGDRFKDGTVFIPEVLLSARAMNEALKVLEPHLASGDQQSQGTVMIGTVRGDLHDIGKNMVLTMLKGVGFKIIDLGVNVKSEDFVREIADKKPDVLGMSALLTTTMPQMQEVIESLIEAGLKESIKVMVGGAPVTEKFAMDIGADGYARDAGEAVSLAKQLMSR
ncbi:MAG: cobalamin-dependent protein [Deltaproteobacteria bacterium]|nr:cobalamin-dependent protein [Deltaproteobacteria bacterium]